MRKYIPQTRRRIFKEVFRVLIMNYLSIDVGTTACKCQLFDEKGNIKEYISKEYSLLNENGETYVDIGAIKENVFSMIKTVAAKHTVNSVCFSTFGETFVLVDKCGNVSCHPMLYTDTRGEAEAKYASKKIGNERIFKISGTVPHPMYSAYKLLWIKNNRPDIYAKADKALLICDYLGFLLTGKCFIDYSLAARTGVLNISTLKYDDALSSEIGIDNKLFSTPFRAGTVVGEVKAEIAEALGIKGCKLVLGAHDQVCTALGAGVIERGQAVDGLGTVECINTVYEGIRDNVKMGEQGLTCIPYAIEGLYCTYIVHYSSGSLVNWFKNDILHGYKGDKSNVFDYLEERMKDGPSGIFTLPYFAGSFIPYQDTRAKGAVIGLTTSTTDADIYKSIMEGLAYEMKFETSIASRYGINIKKAVATGGGANSDVWLQIKADVQGIPYTTLRSSEGGLCGCAVLQAVADGKSYKEAVKIFVKTDKEFETDKQSSAQYAPYYNKYKKLYKSLKEFN